MINISISSIIIAILVIVLLVFQLQIVTDNTQQEYILNGIIVIALFVLTTNLLTKARLNGYLKCPECNNAKMWTSGNWECEKCKKVFGSPEND